METTHTHTMIFSQSSSFNLNHEFNLETENADWEKHINKNTMIEQEMKEGEREGDDDNDERKH